MSKTSDEMNQGVTVTITKRLKGDFSDMSDAELIAFLMEDISVVTDDAHWKFERNR